MTPRRTGAASSLCLLLLASGACAQDAVRPVAELALGSGDEDAASFELLAGFPDELAPPVLRALEQPVPRAKPPETAADAPALRDFTTRLRESGLGDLLLSGLEKLAVAAIVVIGLITGFNSKRR